MKDPFFSQLVVPFCQESFRAASLADRSALLSDLLFHCIILGFSMKKWFAWIIIISLSTEATKWMGNYQGLLTICRYSFVTVPCPFTPTASCLPCRAFYLWFKWNSWSDTNTVSSIKQTSFNLHGQLPQLAIAQEARGGQNVKCARVTCIAAISTFKEWRV